MDNLTLEQRVNPEGGTLSDEQLRDYRERGFLSVENFADLDEVEGVRIAVASLLSTGVGRAEGDQFDALGSVEGDESFIQFFNPHYYDASLCQTAFVERAKLVARQILGPKARLCFTLLIVKPAKIGSYTPWHQDEAFHDPHYDQHTVSFWMALQPVDDQNGCMEFIPGSHSRDVLPHQALQGIESPHVLECVGDFVQSEVVRCPLAAGGVTLHDSRTLHGTGANISDKPRLSFVLKFDVTPTATQSPRSFPWRADLKSARLGRRRVWLLKGGAIREWYRIVAKVNLTDPERMVFYLRRSLAKVAALLRLNRHILS